MKVLFNLGRVLLLSGIAFGLSVNAFAYYGYDDDDDDGSGCQGVQVSTSAQLHDALTGVTPGAVPGAVICIAPGTYLPVVATEEDDLRTRTFKVTVDNLTLHGASTYRTKISGDLGVADDISDNAYTVLLVDTSMVTKLSIKHLKIADGHANVIPDFETESPPFPKFEGGGIYMDGFRPNTQLKLHDVHMADFVAIGVGAAIAMFPDASSILVPKEQQAKLIISNSKFTNNLSGIEEEGELVFGFGQGAAAFIVFVNADIADTRFVDNRAGFSGGAMDIQEGTLNLRRSVFKGGRAIATSGAFRLLMFSDVGGDSSIVDNHFEDNQVVGVDPRGLIFQRAGVSIIEGYAIPGGVVTIRGNTYKNNHSVGVAGAMDILNANARVIDNKFIYNSSGSDGGALSISTTPLAFRGGIEAPVVKVRHNIFSNNRSKSRGGALAIVDTYQPQDPLTMTVYDVNDNVFVGNQAATGGALDVAAILVTAKRNLFVDNRALDSDLDLGNGGAINVTSFTRAGGFFQIIQTPIITDAFGIPFPFQGNDPSDPQGGVTDLIGRINVVDSVFLGNKARVSGGAISDTPNIEEPSYAPGFAGFGEQVLETSPGLANIQVKDSVFLYNRAQQGSGGAIAIIGSGQHKEQLLCPLFNFFTFEPCFEGVPVDIPWYPDESSEKIYTSLKLKDSLVIGNTAAMPGDDVFIADLPYDINIMGSVIDDCEGDGC